jgi:hypothetical protein
MARYRDRGKKALYEVMSQTRQKTGEADTIERLHPLTTDQDKPVQTIEHNTVVTEPKTAIPWWKKPRIVQFNAGRIELSIPYQIAVAVAMGLILVLLLSFRLGQYSAPTPKQTTPKTASGNSATRTGGTNTNTNRSGGTTTPSGTAGSTSTGSGTTGTAAGSAGGNVLVLARYRAKPDLEAARQYFEQNGIPTEIILKNDNMYYLRTTTRFVEDPGRPGTAGYDLKMKIADLGKKYIAPVGYETFKPHLFDDAYGEKVN